MVERAKPKKEVLLLGEGDFSFAATYAKRHPKYRIIATEYMPETQLRTRQGFESNIAKLRKLRNVTILFKIDAQNLEHEGRITGHQFDKIIFNFPNTGERNGSTANLIDKFFKSARHVLKDSAYVQMGLVDTVRYDQSYQINNAAHARFKLQKAVKWDRHGKYPTYNHVSTNLDRKPIKNPCLKYSFIKIRTDDQGFDSDNEYMSDAAGEYEGRLDHITSVKRKSGKGNGTVAMQVYYRKKILEEHKTWANALLMAGQYEGFKQYKEELHLYRRLYRASNPSNREAYKIAYARIKKLYDAQKQPTT